MHKKDKKCHACMQLTIYTTTAWPGGDIYRMDSRETVCATGNGGSSNLKCNVKMTRSINKPSLRNELNTNVKLL